MVIGQKDWRLLPLDKTNASVKYCGFSKFHQLSKLTWQEQEIWAGPCSTLM
jgi:hypothetical protein